MAAAMRQHPLTCRPWGDRWLLGVESDRFWHLLTHYQQHFQATAPRDILLTATDPVIFLAAFFAASDRPGRLWLGNPTWGTQEWAQVAAQCQPDLIIGDAPIHLHPPDAAPHPAALTPRIHIPTGGSSGNIRFAVHDWDTLMASVHGFQAHFHCAPVNAYCVLPLYHVSGLMQAMRCWLSGGVLAIQSFTALAQAGAIAVLPSPAFLSLVPTQLQRLLMGDRALIPWLQSFTAILLGGAPLWDSLRDRARDLGLPLAPTYGMTETAAQVATLLPAEFLAGNRSSGRPLPHTHLTICDETGQPLPPLTPGRITLTASSLAREYGGAPLSQPWQSGDLGYCDADGYLYVLGRDRTLIFTGGEKVLPEEVEAAILQTGLVQDVAVLGIPDGDWGEVVAAAIVPWTSPNNTPVRVSADVLLPPLTDSPLPEEPFQSLIQCLTAHLKAHLSPYKCPKHWRAFPTLPRNAQGKLLRAELQRWLMA